MTAGVGAWKFKPVFLSIEIQIYRFLGVFIDNLLIRYLIWSSFLHYGVLRPVVRCSAFPWRPVGFASCVSVPRACAGQQPPRLYSRAVSVYCAVGAPCGRRRCLANSGTK